MNFLTVRNIWQKIKDYWRELNFSAKMQPQTFAHPSEAPQRIMRKLTKAKSHPVKKYSFKSFQSFCESDDENRKMDVGKTKKIQKVKKNKQEHLFEFNNSDEFQSIPHFLDDNGRQVSSIGKRSNMDDSFDAKEFDDFLKEELEMMLYPMRKKKIKSIDSFFPKKGNKKQNSSSKVFSQSYRKKGISKNGSK